MARPRPRFSPAMSLAGTAVLALGGCGTGSTPRPNVLLIVVDTLRADKLGCYGNGRGLTPALDELASQGLRFQHAYSHAPWTLPSFASLLTSLHPAEHGAGGRLGQFTSLDGSVTTLPEVFGARGYRTHAVANVAFLGERFGVTRDFGGLDIEAPTNNVEMRSAERTTSAALEWLDGGKGPFFLLVHYFDPHAVYAPPPSFRRKFAGPKDREDESWVFGTQLHMVALRAGQLSITPQVVRRAEKLYDGEVAYADGQVERLLDGLGERGLERDTIVVMTADHGEEFLDHDGFEHGHTLYDELTHVPLILRYPRGIEPGVVSQTVAHVDVAPTLCQLADLAPPQQFVGRSLLSLSGEPAAPGRPVLAHGNMWGPPLTSWRVGDRKLIVGADGALELYDLSGDPDERTDLAPTRPKEAAELRQQLDAVLRYMNVRRGGAVDLPPEVEERLRNLGYGGGDDEPLPSENR